MLLSIIITSYKNPELLKLCIDSIKKNITISDYEIIVSDCETVDEVVSLMREDYPEVKFITSEKNLYYGGEVREGYKLAQGKYILILNDDILVKKGTVEGLVSYLETHQSVGIVGPQLLNFNETVQPSCFRFLTPLTIIYRRTFLGKFKFAKRHLDDFLMRDFDHKSIREVDWIMGSAILTRREAIDRVGLFDERFVVYFEDTDWCRRFWENGYKVIYNPEYKMYHYHRRSSAGKGIIRTLISNKLAWLHISSALKYFIKYFGKPVPNHK